MVVVDYDGLLDLDDLPEELAEPAEPVAEPARRHRWPALVGKPLEEIERLFITETLRLTGGNREEAARMLASASGRCIGRSRRYGL